MQRLAFILLILPLFSAAEVVVPIDSVEDSVNIRMTTDAKSEIVGKLQQGSWARLVESTPGWYEIEISGGATGFISADWTNVLGEPPAEPVAEAQLDEPVEPAEFQGPAVVADTVDVVEEPPVEAVTVENPAVSADEVAVEELVAEPAAEVAADEEPVEEIALAEEVVEETVAVPEAAAAETEEVAEVEAAEEVAGVTEPQPEADAEPVAVSAPVVFTTASERGAPGATGPQGLIGPQGPAGGANVEGSVDFLMKFTARTSGGSSQIFDDGNMIGIGTTKPKQRLEVNGNIQIHERNSSVAGLMITQSDGETGYIMHNRASTLTIGAGSVDRITIDRDGNVGFGVTRPSNPIHLASGAHVTAGGVWTNSSSRSRKENISGLSANEALQTLTELEPVHFNYKNDQAESYVGFIAEDVPDLVATRDRDGLSAMDIVAVLTKVVQEQQKKIEALEARLDQQ